MNRVLSIALSFLLTALISNSLSGQTYFYKLKKEINGNTTESSAAGGQFITFRNNQRRCFESDKKGYGVGHGVLEFESANSNGIKTYTGGSYWGNKAVYRFSNDLTKLNVCLDDGTVYVYAQATPPSNQITCSLIRTPERVSGGGTPSTTVTMPGNVASGAVVNPTTTTGGQGVNPTTPSKRWKNIRRTYDCDRCHRSGKCQTCNGKGWYQALYGQATDCPNCDGYKTGRCSKCHGAGTIEKIEQVFE